MALHVYTERTKGDSDGNSLATVVNDALKPFGPLVPRVEVGRGERTGYSIRWQSTTGNQIDVTVDKESLTVRIVDYQLKGSPALAGIQEGIEKGIAKQFNVVAQFREAPCQWFGP